MNAAGPLLQRARLQGALLAALALLPWWLVALLWLDRLERWPLAALAAALALPCLVAAAAVGWRRDHRWLARRLDLRREFEDSADLLWQPARTPAAALQQQRLGSRVAPLRVREVAPRPHPAMLATGLLLPAVLIVLALWRPAAVPDATAPPTPPATVAALPIALSAARLTIDPPGYTGLPTRAVDGLAATVPEASALRWQLQLTGEPDAVALRFHDGEQLALTRVDGSWRGQRTLDRDTHYRLLVDGELLDPEGDPARLQLIRDRPPRIRVTAPTQTLTLLDAAKPLTLELEIDDDYGLAPAELLLTLAQGDGENIEVSERTIPLRGAGDATRRRYRHPIDLAALGFAEGNDLILRVIVADNRTPSPQQVRSAGYILRWPAELAGDVEGFDGLVQRTLPAYFRSQRQIIIDSEALVAARGTITSDRFMLQSDTIGVDQRLLRLRYGQFLGEEAEDAGPALPEGHHPDDGHDHGPPPASGDEARAVIAEFGHLHDEGEAATLFDPATRELLRSALREMWQSELHLRQGEPELALPYQHRALDFIKRVQQASRIHLARVGLELPSIDFERRLSGDRSTLRSRPDPLRAANSGDDAVSPLWHLLATHSTQVSERDHTVAAAAIDNALTTFHQWLRDNEATLEAPLPLYEAVDRLRREPDCRRCIVALRDRLWPLLPVPPAGVAERSGAGDRGGRYLDALQERQQ